MTIIKYLPTQKGHYKRPLEAVLVILHCGACVPKEMHFVGHCVSLKSLRRISPSCVSNIPQKFKMKSNLAFIIKSSFFSYFSNRHQVKWMIPDEKYIDNHLLQQYFSHQQIYITRPNFSNDRAYLQSRVIKLCFGQIIFLKNYVQLIMHFVGHCVSVKSLKHRYVSSMSNVPQIFNSS